MKIGFIGAGRMATALAKGIIEAGHAQGDDVLASDPFESARNSFQETSGGIATTDSSEVIQFTDTIFLAVKPQLMEEVASQVKGKLTENHLLISIAAGVTLERLGELFGEKVRLVRVMPNTPALVGSGASAYCLGETANQDDATQVEILLNAVGISKQIPERLMDSVTGLSGSGPAFVYLFIEAMSDAGVLKGLPRDTATELAAQTVLGAAEMVLKTNQHPGVLKDQVTSPGGTTIAGINALENASFRSSILNAVAAATERSAELGK
jgi:pyrroline-5-carboxylate reductase